MQIIKVANTNHLDMVEMVCVKMVEKKSMSNPVCVTSTEFSQLQCTEKVGNFVVDFVAKSA